MKRLFTYTPVPLPGIGVSLLCPLPRIRVLLLYLLFLSGILISMWYAAKTMTYGTSPFHYKRKSQGSQTPLWYRLRRLDNFCPRLHLWGQTSNLILFWIWKVLGMQINIHIWESDKRSVKNVTHKNHTTYAYLRFIHADRYFNLVSYIYTRSRGHSVRIIFSTKRAK